MQTIEIVAESRNGGGKAEARRVRRSGKIPAVFYGPKSEPQLLAVDKKEFTNKVMILEGSHLIRFRSEIAAVSDRVALVKDTQFNAVSGDVTHADFYEVDLNTPIRVPVPIHYTGKPVGVVNGGILQPIQRDVEVECLPLSIPEYVVVDVTPLGIHDAFHVSQLNLPEGVKAIYETDVALVTVVPPSVADTKGEGGAAAEGAAAAATPAAAPAKGADS